MPRGRPRKKEVRIFCLDGGESAVTAWGKTPSMRQGPVVEEIGDVVEGGEEIIKESVGPLTHGRWANKPNPSDSPKAASDSARHTSNLLCIPLFSFSLPLSLYTQKETT